MIKPTDTVPNRYSVPGRRNMAWVNPKLFPHRQSKSFCESDIAVAAIWQRLVIGRCSVAPHARTKVNGLGVLRRTSSKGRFCFLACHANARGIELNLVDQRDVFVDEQSGCRRASSGEDAIEEMPRVAPGEVSSGHLQSFPVSRCLSCYLANRWHDPRRRGLL